MKRRQDLHITQHELADLAGVGINTLVAIERGDWKSVLEDTQQII